MVEIFETRFGDWGKCLTVRETTTQSECTLVVTSKGKSKVSQTKGEYATRMKADEGWVRFPTSMKVVACLLLVLFCSLPFCSCLDAELLEEKPLDSALLHSYRVKMGVLGLRPAENTSEIQRKCDKVLYEQVAMRIALDHIANQNNSIVDLSKMIPAKIVADPIYISKSVSEIVGNVTVWSKNNIESCAQHEILHDIDTEASVMVHEDDDLPNTVDLLLGPRSAINYECQMMQQIAALGRLPMVTWGCTAKEMGVGLGLGLNSTTISMLPDNTESIQSHAIMDFLHDHNWDQGHVAVIHSNDDSKAQQLIQNLNRVSKCRDSSHGVLIHGYGFDPNSPEEIEDTLDQIKTGHHNIILSTLWFRDLPMVLYRAKKLGLVGKDNIWIHTHDFTPTQLEVAASNSICQTDDPSGITFNTHCDDEDAALRIGELLHGSFTVGWTPGGADYTKINNPWEKFKEVWSEQSTSDYPDLGLPEDFFDYPPLSANAALVYDSAWIGLVSYMFAMAAGDGFYDTRHGDHQGHLDLVASAGLGHVSADGDTIASELSPDHHDHHDHGTQNSTKNHTGHGRHSPNHLLKDFTPDVKGHHEGEESYAAHLHVCANKHVGYGYRVWFEGVTGAVEINDKTRARVPIANIMSAINLQWSGSSLEPYEYGKWPYTWDKSWVEMCDIPDISLWERRQQLTPLKYGSSEKPPEYRSSYSQSTTQNANQKKMIMVIGILVATLALLSICIVLLFWRYRRVHRRIIHNEKVVNDFQFEWETNAGRALTMLSSLIDTMGDKKGGSDNNKQSFEKKLAQIRRFLLAQDARIEMKEVQSSIEKVGAERYTPEVTAYLMAQAINTSQDMEEDCVYKRSESFENKLNKSNVENVLHQSIRKSEAEGNLSSSTDGGGESTTIKRSFSLASTESLEAISPVVDSVILAQVRDKLLASLNLAATGSVSFDVFELATLTGDRPLSTLALYLLHRRGVCSALRLNTDKLIAFVLEAENMMFEHPYHNRRHVADVVAGMYVFTLPGGCLYDLVHSSPLAMLSVVFAATIHDLQHTGVNNNFLSKTLHPLAIRHSDKSVNESHHLSSAFDLLGQDDYNFMENVEREDLITFRSLVIEMVMATDMKSHFSILDSFKMFQKARQEDPKSVKILTEMRNVFCLAMKVADLFHCSRPLEMHHRWVDLITEEFFTQGDLETEKGMKISPGMDRSQPPGPLQQVGFTEIFVLPLFKTWSEYARNFGSQDGQREFICYEGVERNYKFWLHASKQPSNPASLSNSDDSR